MKKSKLARIAEGLQIVLKYDDGDGEVAVGHDQMWIGAGVTVSDEDKNRLKDMGWFEDEESWSHFV